MRIVAMVLGLIGAPIGALGVYRGWPGVQGEYLAWGIFSSLIGIAGGILALRRPGVAGILMLVSGIGGWSALIAVWIFEGLWCRVYGAPTICLAHLYFYNAYLNAGPPLFIGGALSLISCKEYQRGSIAAMVFGLIGGLVGALAVNVSALYFGGVAPRIMALGLVLPAIGITGGALSLTRPAPGGTVMLVSGTSGIVASFLGWHHFAYSVAYMFASVPLITGAALSFTAPMAYPRGSRLVMALGIGAGLLGAFGAGPAFHFRCPVLIPWTILVFLMAIGGAMLALTRPKAAGALMLLIDIAGWLVPVGMIALAWGIRLELAGIYVAGLYFLAGFLLIAGGILSFLFSRKRGASKGSFPSQHPLAGRS